MFRQLVALALLPGLTGCLFGSRDDDYYDDLYDPQYETRPVVTFGTDTGTPSEDAEELLSKPATNPNPDTLVGVYELTGYGSADDPNNYLILTNNWRVRREIREDSIVIAMECTFELGGATDQTEVVTVFTSSPITREEWGFRIEENARDEKSVFGEYGFDAKCGVELAAMDQPYCVAEFDGDYRTGSARVPSGYSTCITVEQGYLRFVGNPSFEAGKKLSN